MNEIWLSSLVSVFLVSLVSLVGIFSFGVKVQRLKDFLIFVISFSAGALFGDAFIHLLPEVIRERGFGLDISMYILLGIVIFFVLEKFVHWQHYHSHGECEEIHGKCKEKHAKSFAYVNIAGSALHDFTDGLAIVASYLISVPVGIATTIAVALHEIPHNFGTFGILVHGGFSRGRALFISFLCGLSAVIGALVALWLSKYISGLSSTIAAIVVGGFVYIAGSDLIPELHKDTNAGRSFWQLIAFILGIAVMAALLLVE